MVQDRRRCPGITSQGKSCPLFPPAGHTYCINHDPDRTAEKHDRSVKGGQNKAAAVRARKLLKGNLETMSDMLEIVKVITLGVIEGTIPPNVGLVVSNLARTAGTLTVTVTLEQEIANQHRRLAILEESLNIRDAERRAG